MFATKHMDMVTGVDVHLVNIPSPAGPVPTPIPHPYMGLVFDSMDLLPPNIPLISGASLYVNGMRRCQAGTKSTSTPVHIPLGAGFTPPIPLNEAEAFMGSATVAVDGSPFTSMGLPFLSCSSIGMPAPLRATKPKKSFGLVLPTSIVISPASGMPVMIGGPPTIDLIKLLIPFGLKGLGKVTGKALSDIVGDGVSNLLSNVSSNVSRNVASGVASNTVSNIVDNSANSILSGTSFGATVRNQVNRSACFVTGDPVDIATGKVFTEVNDFSLPGPIPFNWKRIWYSTSTVQSSLGHGWHHNYDMLLAMDDSGKAIVLRNNDGRTIVMPALHNHEFHQNKQDRIRLIKENNQYRLINSDGLIWHFGSLSAGKTVPIQKIENRNKAHSIEFIYNNGNLTTIKDSANRIVNIKNDKQGRIVEVSTKVKNKNHVFVQYRYDVKDNLIQTTDSLNQSFLYDYDNHLLIKQTNKKGLSFYYEYEGKNAQAKCIHTWGDEGLLERFLDYEEGLTRVTNSLGFVEHFFHNGNLVTKHIDAKGGTKEYKYTKDFQLLEEINPMGLATTYTYNKYGNQTSIITPDGAKLTKHFNEWNQIETIIDKNGGYTFYQYDESGNLTSVIFPDRQISIFEYTDGNRTKIIRSNQTIALKYNNNNQLISLTKANHLQEFFKYDELGNTIEYTDVRGNSERSSYDLLNRVTKTYLPNGNLFLFKYDASDNIIEVKDNYRKVTFIYEGLNQITKRTENNHSIQFRYNTEEKLLYIQNEKYEYYRFAYDENGMVIEETGFDGLRKKFRRDANQNIVAIELPNNLVNQYKLNEVGRVLSILYYDGTIDQFEYRHDGQLMVAKNADLKVKIERDSVGRILKSTQGELAVESNYDSLGNRTQIHSSLGANIQLQYNKKGNLAKSFVGKWQTDFTYDEYGVEKRRALPGEIQLHWNHDLIGRAINHQITGGGNQIIRERKYEWNSMNRIEVIDDSNFGETLYNYDAKGNLIASSSTRGEMIWRVFDEVGNSYRAKNKTDRTYNKGGKLFQDKKWTYLYDELGRLIEKRPKNAANVNSSRAFKYHWDARNQLIQVDCPNNKIVTMKYDALGRRISKSVFDTYAENSNEKHKTTHWLWDGDVPLHEWQTSKQLSHSFIDQDGELTINENQLITWVFDEQSLSPRAKVIGNEYFTIITDYMGSPIQMTSSKGQTVFECEQTIYGKIRTVTGNKYDCPFRYPGQYEDEDFGLHYNRLRYYDPESGIYLSPDPEGLASGETNVYVFCAEHTVWGEDSVFNPNIIENVGQPRVNSRFGQIQKADLELKKLSSV